MTGLPPDHVVADELITVSFHVVLRTPELAELRIEEMNQAQLGSICNAKAGLGLNVGVVWGPRHPGTHSFVAYDYMCWSRPSAVSSQTSKKP